MIARIESRRLLLLLLGGLAAATLFGPSGCLHAPATRERRVLVMNFENALAEPQTRNLGRSLADLMTGSLANAPPVVAVERQNLGALLQDAENRPAVWQPLGRKVDADYLVVGSLGRLNRNYVINVRLFSVDGGEVVRGSSVTRYCNRPEDLDPLVEAMSRVLAAQIKYLADLSAAQAQGAPPLPLSKPSAASAVNP